MKSLIQINNTDITLRPSSIDSFLGCSYQWARVFLTGETSIPSARASIGTGVHAGIEHMWTEIMPSGDKSQFSMPAAIDAAVEAFQEDIQQGVQFDEGEDKNTAISEIVQGVGVFAEDIMPFAEVPRAVEKRFTIPIAEHPIVAAVSGTVDYITDDTIADVKTSKRLATPANYEIQQSLYKTLARANGVDVQQNLIHNVVFTKVPKGQILDMQTNEAKAKVIVNNLLDTLQLLATDKIQPELLFRGNPKYYLCSDKYCAFHSTCMFVKGEEPEAPREVVKL